MTRSFFRRVFPLLAACALLAAPVLAIVDEAPQGPAIPPNQEDVMLAMLGGGAKLPGGCELKGAGVEYTVIKATYGCELGDVVVELSYPLVEDPADVETDAFALEVLEGSPPEGFADALTALIREREADFVWVNPAAQPAERPGEDAATLE